MFLSYEEQAIIKMYNFSSKEELKKKLKKGLDEIEDKDMKNIVVALIPKIDNFTVEDLQNLDNFFE